MSLCFIDTETTGVHPDRQVWEIAMIRDEPHFGETTFFVDVDLSNADPFGLKVGHFYERHPWGRWLSMSIPTTTVDQHREMGSLVDTASAAQAVACWTHGAHLVGAVPDFDARTLDPLLRAHGLIPAWHYHLIDIEAMAVGWLNSQAQMKSYPEVLSPTQTAELTTPPWKSDDLARVCGVEPPSEDERHTALGDARWAKRWYEAITR